MQTYTSKHTRFYQEVLAGLSAPLKYVSSKYFYDDEGSRLFKKIMGLDAYYLTRTEHDIFVEHGDEMCRLFSNNFGSYINVVELGAGDGSKTKLLLKALQSGACRFLYSPIDISCEALRHLEYNIHSDFPEISMNAMEGDYFEMLNKVAQLNHGPKVILFLGSSIGNFSNTKAVLFMQKVGATMCADDHFVIGFDLVKDATKILNAYNDKEGVTSAFNMNLLSRFNSEMGADFVLEEFEHCAVYDPVKQAALSYLVSKKQQTVRFSKFDTSISFDAWEPIHTETSHKYTMERIKQLADSAGFELEHCFYDDEKYFVDVVLRLKMG